MITKDVIWSQKYRPGTVEQCILPDEIKIPFQNYADSGEVPNLLLSGGPGIGKSSIAQALCDQLDLTCMFWPCGVENRGIGIFQGVIRDFASSISFNGKRKIVILDEADMLTPDAQEAFRALIEKYSKNCSFILTCNYPAKIIPAIRESRMTHIEFRIRKDQKIKMASQFLVRACAILDTEKVEYDKKVVAEIIQSNFPDFRKTINELQRFSTFGAINTGIMPFLAEMPVNDLVEAMKDKNVHACRKWLVNNLEDSGLLYRKVYDRVWEQVKPESLPQAILIMAKYQYQDAFAIDKEINTMAFLIDFMTEVEFK